MGHNALPKPYKKFTDKYAVHAPMDIFYIPQTAAAKFQELAPYFLCSKTYFSLATPTLFHMISHFHGVAIQNLNGLSAWYNAAANGTCGGSTWTIRNRLHITIRSNYR